MNWKAILENLERGYMSEDSCQNIESKSVRLRAGHSSDSVRSQNMGFRVARYGSNFVYSYFQDGVGNNGISPFKLLIVWGKLVEECNQSK